MQRRHFELIARTIRELDGSMTLADRDCVAEHFAAALAQTNPQFNAARFIAACRESK